VIFDDVFEGGETLAAFGVFAAGAGAVGVTDTGTFSVAVEMVFNLFIVEGVT